MPSSKSSESSWRRSPTKWRFPIASRRSCTMFAPLVTTASTYPSLIRSVKISLMPLGTRGPEMARKVV